MTTKNEQISTRDRILTHRVVEWVASHEATQDTGAAMAACGITVPEHAHGLLREELARLEARREAWLAELEMAREAEFASGWVFDAPVDPYGDLAGGRCGISRLLCRRIDNRRRRRGSRASSPVSSGIVGSSGGNRCGVAWNERVSGLRPPTDPCRRLTPAAVVARLRRAGCARPAARVVCCAWALPRVEFQGCVG